MSSRQRTARLAGALYFALMIVSIVGEFFMPNWVVSGDAAATARKVVVSEGMYRLDILIGFTTLALLIAVAAALYRLLRDVDRGYALLMVLLVMAGIAVGFANLLNRFAPLVILKDAGYLSVLTQPQRDALVLNALRLHRSAAAIAQGFWGLWLFPFGILVVRSGFLPRILGFALLVAGAAYVAGCVVSIALPEVRGVVTRFLLPLYFGEVPIILWLLVRGASGSEVGSVYPRSSATA